MKCLGLLGTRSSGKCHSQIQCLRSHFSYQMPSSGWHLAGREEDRLSRCYLLEITLGWLSQHTTWAGRLMSHSVTTAAKPPCHGKRDTLCLYLAASLGVCHHGISGSLWVSQLRLFGGQECTSWRACRLHIWPFLGRPGHSSKDCALNMNIKAVYGLAACTDPI